MRRWTLLQQIMVVIVGLLLIYMGSQPLLRRTLVVQVLGRSPLYSGQGHVPFVSGGNILWHLRVRPLMQRSAFEDSAFSANQSINKDDAQEEVARIIESFFLQSNLSSSQQIAQFKNTVQQFDRHLTLVENRLPDKNYQVWLCALRAQWKLYWMRHDRIAGELVDVDWKKHREQKIPPLEKSTLPPNFTPLEIENALKIVARGEILEPKNAYWDWMRAQFLIYAWRDDQAWQALENGARKKHFNGHELETVQSYVKAYEKGLGRPLLPEELNVVQHVVQEFSFSGRSMARLISWQALKATQSGQHEKALRIYYGYTAMQLLRAQKLYRVNEARMALNMMALVLSRERTLGNLLVIDTNLRNGLDADLKSIESYAARCASRATQAKITGLFQRVRETCKRQELFNNQLIALSYKQGMQVAPWHVSLGAFGLGVVFLQQIFVAGAAWLFLKLIFQFLLPPKVANSTAIERSDSVFAVFLLCVVTLLTAYSSFEMSGRLGLGDEIAFRREWSLIDGFSEAATVIYPCGLLIPLVFSSLLVQGMTGWRAFAANLRHKICRKNREIAIAPWAGQVTSLLFTSAIFYWWQTALLVPDAEWLIRPNRLSIAGFNLPGSSLLRWASHYPLISIFFCLLAMFAGWMRWIFTANAPRRALILYRLRWLHQLIGASALLSLAGYFAVTFYALPARHMANREVQTLILRGDNALWQSRLDELIAAKQIVAESN